MAEVARFLACAEPAQWRLLITDQKGVLYDYARTTYRPPAELRRFLQARDRTRRFPGCNRPAPLCEADHLERWTDDGTTAMNTTCACSPAATTTPQTTTAGRPPASPTGPPTGAHPPATNPVDVTVGDPDPPPF